MIRSHFTRFCSFFSVFIRGFHTCSAFGLPRSVLSRQLAVSMDTAVQGFVPKQHRHTKYSRHGEAPRGNPCANFSAGKRCVVCRLGPCICKVALMPRLTSLQDWLGGGDTAMAGRLHLQDCPHATALACHQAHGESSEDGSSRGRRRWRRDTVAAAEAATRSS